MKERKIIQIAVAGATENQQTQAEALIVVLADDGSLWCTTNRYASSPWEQLPPLPPDMSKLAASK